MMVRKSHIWTVTALLCGVLPSIASSTVTYQSIPIVLKAAYQAKNANNCVLFLRNDMGVKLPNVDLTTWNAKKSIVNMTGTPRAGDVAVITTPGTYAAYGHVALVVDVTTTSISILEAHYSGNTVTMRRATGKNLADAQSQLNIYGFYRPR